MQLIRGQHNFHRHVGECYATIGTFDGLHLGHQKILACLKAKAKAAGLPAVVILFEPQPQEFLFPNKTVPRLMRLRDKLTGLRKLGIDVVVCLKFNKDLAALSAEAFIEKILVKSLRIAHLVVGDDFRFGSDRRGDYALLLQYANRGAFSVEPTPTIEVENERISSTRVRNAILAGDFSLSLKLLGRPYALIGRVHHGDKRGRQLGFPTLNIPLKALLAVNGVYAVSVSGLKEGSLIGVANVGIRPTVGGMRRLLEVHLFDADVDAYGKHIEVTFFACLRQEKKFASLLDLKRQIVEDVAQARAYFNENPL